MKKSMVVGFAAMAFSVFANPFDDADMVVIGAQDKNGNGYLEAGEFMDARHVGSTTAISYKLQQYKRSSPVPTNYARVTTDTVVVGPYQQQLANEPIIHLEPYFDPADPTQMTNLPTTIQLSQKPFTSDKWTFVWRFRPMKYTAQNADGYFLNIGNNWGAGQGVIFYRKSVNANRDGGTLQFNTGKDSGNLTFGESSAPVVFANDRWHEMVVIGNGTTLTVGFRQLGTTPVAFTGAPTTMRWQTFNLTSSTMTMGNNYLRFGCPYDSWDGVRRGGFQGDVHLMATWSRTLSKDEAETVLASGGTPALAAVGLCEADDVASVFQGTAGTDVTVGESPATWKNIPATLTKGAKLNVTFAVAAHQDGRMKMLHLYPANTSGAGTVDVLLDDETLGSVDLVGGQEATLFVSGSLLPSGAHTLTLVRTDAGATALSLKGLEFRKTGEPLVGPGSVFDDATAIIMAGEDRNGNGFIDEGECVDVRHPGRATGHSYKVHQHRRQPDTKNSMYFTTDTVRIGSRNVELKDEPVIRLDTAVLKTNIVEDADSGTTVTNETFIPNALVFDKGVPFTTDSWSVLIRFKPEAYGVTSTDGYFMNVGNEWATGKSLIAYLRANDSADLDKHRIDIKTGKAEQVGIPNFNITNSVWTEFAIVADKDHYRLAMRHLRSPGNPGQGGNEMLDRMTFFTWRPANSTTTPKNPYIRIGNPIDIAQAFNSRNGFKGNIHMVGLWDRALGTNEIYEAFSGGRPALLSVGLTKSESVSEVFTNALGSTATISEHPLTWGALPPALVRNAPVSIRFSVLDWYAGLPQVLRLVPADDSGSGAVQVALDGEILETVTAGDGQIGYAYIRGSKLTKGPHTLTLMRVDSAANLFFLRGYRLEGSVQIGYANGTPGFTDGEFSYQSHATTPYMYWLTDGSFRDLSGQIVNNFDHTLRLGFDIPQDLLDRKYRFFYETRIVAFGTGNPEAGMGYGYQLNDGPTNYLGKTAGTNYRFQLEPDLLKPTDNVLKLIDLDNKTNYHYTQFDFHRFTVKGEKTGFMLLVR